MLIGIGAERGALALRGRQILDGEGDAVEMPQLLAGLYRLVGRLGLGPGLFGIGEAEAVEAGVRLLEVERYMIRPGRVPGNTFP